MCINAWELWIRVREVDLTLGGLSAMSVWQTWDGEKGK